MAVPVGGVKERRGDRPGSEGTTGLSLPPRPLVKTVGEEARGPANEEVTRLPPRPLVKMVGERGDRQYRCSCHRLIFVQRGNDIELKCGKCKKSIVIHTRGIDGVTEY
ncbi:MAG: hypothetical protein M1299_09340 [Firmicutes bacterium]|nr:hypothetical protein [Bacillota bacterium]MCL5040010.1 hypothetical protein [Bacillota bacterium]